MRAALKNECTDFRVEGPTKRSQESDDKKPAHEVSNRHKRKMQVTLTVIMLRGSHGRGKSQFHITDVTPPPPYPIMTIVETFTTKLVVRTDNTLQN